MAQPPDRPFGVITGQGGRAGQSRTGCRARVFGPGTGDHHRALGPQFRELVRVYLADGGYPQMIVRLGRTSQTAISVRRPVHDVLLL